MEKFEAPRNSASAREKRKAEEPTESDRPKRPMASSTVESAPLEQFVSDESDDADDESEDDYIRVTEDDPYGLEYLAREEARQAQEKANSEENQAPVDLPQARVPSP
jgi:hypothetical protein